MAENGLFSLRPRTDSSFMTVLRDAFLYAHEDTGIRVRRVFFGDALEALRLLPKVCAGHPPRRRSLPPTPRICGGWTR